MVHILGKKNYLKNLFPTAIKLEGGGGINQLMARPWNYLEQNFSCGFPYLEQIINDNLRLTPKYWKLKPINQFPYIFFIKGSRKKSFF